MVTREAWLAQATTRLQAAGCEDAAFDVRCMLEDFGGLPRGHRADDVVLSRQQTDVLDRALEQRLAGRPLQYILGEWDFLNLTLRVGEGVLIPRPDTEVLCQAAADRLASLADARVLDLCAGSGCVGLGVASLCRRVSVVAVELSDEALPYLQENVSRYPTCDVTVRQANVLTDVNAFEDGWDAILSNPPYIPTGDLAGLQREVQQEPRMALDGDADGLRFYRVLANRWTNKLRDGGFLAVEVGIGQAADVMALFIDAGLRDVVAVPDLGGILRVVIGTK